MASQPDRPSGDTTEVNTAEVNTAELNITEQGDADAAPVPLPTFEWAGVTHVGHVRKVNEDSWFGSDDVCIVADGMGGHAAGEVASGLVAQLVSDVFGAHRLDLSELPAFVSALNSAVLRRGNENGTPGMGTTLVGVALAGNGTTPSVVVFHVGDSRCYQVIGESFRQVTGDHSHVQEMLAAGRISEEEAIGHPLKNVITRALGADVSVEADFHVIAEQDCRLMLCSDGLSDEVDNPTIAQVMRDVADPQEAAQQLVDLALEGDARDNITVVVVDVSFPAVVTRDDDATAMVDITADSAITDPNPLDGIVMGSSDTTVEEHDSPTIEQPAIFSSAEPTAEQPIIMSVPKFAPTPNEDSTVEQHPGAADPFVAPPDSQPVPMVFEDRVDMPRPAPTWSAPAPSDAVDAPVSDTPNDE